MDRRYARGQTTRYALLCSKSRWSRKDSPEFKDALRREIWGEEHDGEDAEEETTQRRRIPEDGQETEAHQRSSSLG